jgi:hypothetical protein
MTSLVSEPGQAPWCERCEWGLDHFEPPKRLRWLGRRIAAMEHRLAYRATMAQFAALEGKKPKRLRLGLAGAFILGVALLFYVIEVGLVAAGVWLIAFDFPNPTMILGALLLLVAWVVVVPRRRLEDPSEPVARAAAPTLFALVDRVAAAAGTPAPAIIVVDGGYGSGMTALGLRRKRVLRLGLMLWGGLEPQQRVALLASDCGHLAQGDVRRGLLTRPAMTALARLSAALRPGRRVTDAVWGGLDPYDFMSTGRYWGSIIGPRLSTDTFGKLLTNGILRALASGLLITHECVAAVGLRAAQRTEYFADHVAARVAGSRATTELIDVMDDASAGVVAASARRGELAAGWRAALSQLREDRRGRLDRVRQLSVRREVSLWASRPPSGLRARLVADAPQVTPMVGLSDSESAQIDAELEPYYKQFQRQIAASEL